ncbi:sugar phosphate isomerase/epimerase [Pseudooceanicola sp. CBS1P-1]|uniref:TIM barrel protein n=1 Tax=Pseudooceanicola albus TaxID=2692189 RepID=A0A6L7G5E3_9RHOB|nr:MULTISPECIES: sugar phosphate isomerase/epimerase family protein [Pseudooceanicola]MBT9386832.1 sugar phosphate isomerase/epimerase [Pseudooceanicola endophyticus]MXN19345.1 TIM barrel protein [Pseudooceanicola albus]
MMTQTATRPTSFHSGLLSDLPVREAVRMIRDHGYDMAELNAELLPWGPAHIGLDTPVSEIDALAGMGPYSALCIHHRDFGSRDADRRDAARLWGEAMMERAVDLGIPLVHVIPGEETTVTALHEELARAVEAAARRDLTLALEPIVGRQIGTWRTALEAIAAAPGLKINFDPSHLKPMGDDVAEAATRLVPHVVHMHLKDVTGTSETFRFVPIGTGEIDLASMFGALDAGGYAGPVSIEHESHWFVGDARSPSQVLKDGLADIRRLQQEARQAAVS